MMFEKKVYVGRRAELKKKLSEGIVMIPGNVESSYNYPDNQYRWRQDSNFSYFFGINLPGMIGIMDLDNDKDILFGTDFTVDDIIWMGSQPTLKENASKVGIKDVRDYALLQEYLLDAIHHGRKIHFMPLYRGEQKLEMSRLLGIKPSIINEYASTALSDAVISLREIKSEEEIEEIEKAEETAYLMHTTAMKMAKSGVYEYEIAGRIEGIALSRNGYISFPVILSINGQTLHNHSHANKLRKGRMLVVDAGAETDTYYASDITRSIPVDGKFDSRQKDIYQAVLAAQLKGIELVKPGSSNTDNHIAAVTVLLDCLKDIGLVKGNTHDAVMNGVGAFFMPHGLGHQMGMDVHDMEGLGENRVGYDSRHKRSTIAGISSLRMGKQLKVGHVFTVEPGCYFIPAWFDKWKAENRCAEFINYDKVATYLDFGGIRIEDDVLVVKGGHRVLGRRPIPKTIDEVEECCGQKM